MIHPNDPARATARSSPRSSDADTDSEPAPAFKQRTSFLRRQSLIIAFVVLAFGIQAAGVYFASATLLSGLTRVSTYNRLYDLTTQTIDAQVSANEALDKALAAPSNRPKGGIDGVFSASLNETISTLDRAIGESRDADPRTREALGKARSALDDYGVQGAAAIAEARATDPASRDRVPHALLARQFAIEFSESLRKAQLRIRDDANRVFEATYAGRYFPTIVSLALALLSATAIFVSSLFVNRQLRRSIRNLLLATDTVAAGDLGYRAPILQSDEVGRVTAAVNDMVGQLSIGRERLERLQSVTAAFSEALSKEGVADVILSQVLQTLGASAGSIVQIDPDGYLRILFTKGHAPDAIAAWKRFAPESHTPVADAIRERRVIWIETAEDFRREYEATLGSGFSATARAYVALPLIVGGQVIGGIGLGFDHERAFSPEDRSFCLSLARQCAQALTRADLYDQSQAAVRVRDEFLSIASHELRTPLTPLKMQIQGLERLVELGRVRGDDPARLSRMLATSHAQITRLTRLVDELLDTTRIEAGKLELEDSIGDLSNLLAEIADRFLASRESGSERGADKAEDRADAPPAPAIALDVEAGLVGPFDRFRMDQVVTNLLTNALKYGGGHPVRLSARRVDRYAVEFTVSDRGIGIAAEDQGRIFDRFERAVSSLNYGGLGLGLYITRQIVERHGGTIRVESETGAGSSFIVRLPFPLA